MKLLQKSLIQFLTGNNGWIMVVSLTAIWMLWILTINTASGTMLYLKMSVYIFFLKQLIAQFLLFSPLIIFCFFRKQIAARVSVTLYYLLWFIVFFLCPFLLGLSDAVVESQPVIIRSEIIWIFGILLICVELISSPTTKFSLKIDSSVWREKSSPEWIVISIFLLISIYSTFQLLNINGAEGTFLTVWLQNVLMLTVYYIFYRINHYGLMVHVYRKKGVVYYGFAFIGLVIIFLIPLLALYYYLPGFRTLLSYRTSEEWIAPNPPYAFWTIYMGTPITMMLFTIPLTILIQWFKQTNKIVNLQKEKTTTELNLLKQQINPHFFFNTLNNVYSMSLTKDEKTPEVILQLSDLMRYVIYNGQESTVSLNEEIKYLEDFLKLQSLRLHHRIDLKFDKEIEDENFQIAPLLFIILIENAFKHGLEGAGKESLLHISLLQNESKLVFSCINSFEEEKNRIPGLGLKNLKRRLELIYPDQHELIIDNDENQYKAQLIIYF